MVNSDLIFTTYFTSKPDPQKRSRGTFNLLKRFKTWLRSNKGGARAEKHGVADIDEFDRIQIWYDSLIKVGCHGVIFHDGLSEWFTEKYACEQVSFIPYQLQTQRSLNDERYYCYLNYLRQHPEIQRIIMCDLFDIEFFRNPFELFDDARYDVYCGGDEGEYNNKLVREKMIATFGAPHYESEIKLNAGTAGGNRQQVEKLLVEMTGTFDSLSATGVMDNVNMAVFNKCVYDLFDKSRIMWGRPLNSRFKAYESSGDFAIRHK